MTLATAPVASRSLAAVRKTPDNAPFFIFGCPRSGTSLLSKMLGAHPRLAIPDESHLYSQVYPVVQRHGDLSSASTRALLVGEILQTEHIRRWTPALSISEVLEATTRHDFHGVVDGLLRAWASKQGKSRWGEKTPQHTLSWRSILAEFPGVRAIHLVRDGRDVMLSYRSAFFGPKHVYPLALRWQQYLEAAEAARRFLGPQLFLQVRYEDLVANPEKELGRICNFLGEDSTPAMLAYHEHCTTTSLCDRRNAQNLRRPVLSDNTGKWRTRMTDRERRIFESVAGSSLERYGYERSLAEPRISTLEALSCRFLEHPPRRIAAMLKNRQARRLALQKLRLHLSLFLNVR